jgi:hypothetical protein
MRKPTSWERKALKAAKANESEPEMKPKIVKEQPQARRHETVKPRAASAAKAEVKRHQPIADASGSSSGSSDDDSSDDASSSDGQGDMPPKTKGASAQVPSRKKTKILLKRERIVKTKKERIVSVTFEHFAVEERDFHGISVSTARGSMRPQHVIHDPESAGTTEQFFGGV